MQPLCTPFPIMNQSIVPCPILTCFLSCIQEAGKVVLYSHLFKNIPQFVVIHTVKGFSVMNSFAFSMIQQMLAIWFLVHLPFLNPACTSESSWFTSYWSLAWRILSIILLARKSPYGQYWNECNCVVVWIFFGIVFLWEWKLTFSSSVATAEFSKFTDILSAAL